MEEKKDAFDFMVEVDDLQEKIDELNDRITELECDKEDLNDRINELETSLNDLNREYDDIVSERDDIQESYDVLTDYYYRKICTIVIIEIEKFNNEKHHLLFETNPDDIEIRNELSDLGIKDFDIEKDKWKKTVIDLELVNNGGMI